MEKKLQPMKNKLLLFFFFVLSGIVFSQNLVRYPLSSNLVPAEGPAAGMQIPNVDMIKYMDPPNQITPTNYTFGYLNFDNDDDEVVLTFDASNYQGMSVQFTAGLGVIGFGGSTGNVKVYLKIGTGTETLLDQANVSASFFGVDTHDFAPALTGADNEPLVQIRIVGRKTVSGWLASFFGIQNLRIVSDNTNMNIRRNATGYPNIPYNSDASVTLDTDFGSRFTNDPNNDQASEDKEYRITNTGLRPLKISSLNVSPSDQGFSIVSSPASTVAVGGFTTFRVRFSPQNQGLKIANIIMNSNAIPNNPFTFQVKGNGKSCNLEPVPILVQNFETSGSNLNASVIAGTPNVTGGNSSSPNPNPIGGALFPSNTNLSAPGSSTRSLYVRGTSTGDENGVVGTGEVTLEFGGVDLTGQQEVSVNFEVAAFGTTSSGSGVNGNDYVLLQVMNPDNSWSDEIRLIGSTSTADQSRSYKYGFGQTQITESNYDGTLFTATNSNSTKYGKFKLNIPASALTSNFKFRIIAKTGQSRGSWISTGWTSGYYPYYNRNLWLIDNVHIDAGNAKVKTWTGTGWTGENTNPPTDREKAVFNGTYNFPSDLTVCECEVKSGKNVTIPANRAFTVRNKITNLGDGSNFTVESDANLIQIEDNAVNTGSITAERDVADMDNVLGTQMDYVYWSAPVTGQDLRAFSPGTRTNKIFYYNEPNDLFKAVNFTTEPNFIPGKGYAFEAETTANGTHSPNTTGYNETYKFKGVPNNGVININVQRSANTGTNNAVEHGYNLIGNPYPSNMSFPQFYAMNSGIIYNTAWFWTNNSYIPNQQGSGYEQNNYAVWTGTGGAPATTTSAADGSGDTFIPDGIVAVGQGFIVQVRPEYIGTGPQQLIFKNKNGSNMVRVSTTGHFFNKEGDQKDRFWLKLISSDSIVNTQLIGYIEGATNDFEKDYDAEIMGMSSNIFYSTLEDRKLQIQGKAAFDPSDNVQLGANIFKNGTYTIAIENPEGIFNAGQKVYLKDNLLNRWVDLNAQSYTFEATKGITEGRFEIVYESPTVLATDAVTKDELMVYRDGNSFVVKSAVKNITGIEVYDVSGRLWKKLNVNSKEVTFDASALNSGMYILKINRNGEISGRKIMK